MKALVFTGAMLGAASLLAQVPFPLKDLRVEGNKEVPAQRILAVSGLRVGAAVDKPDFDAARQKLLDTGVFQSVGYEYKPSADGQGYDAVFRVAESGAHYKYRFEDLPASDDTLRVIVRGQEPLLDDAIPGTPALLARFAAAIQASLPGNPAVTGFLSSDTAVPAVVFRPASGRMNIAEVWFEGNKAIESSTLLRAFSQIAVGTVFTEASLRERLEGGVRPLYEARGHLRVSFPKIEVKKHEKIDGLVATVTVDEGEEYKLGNIRVTPAGDKLAEVAKGDTADFDAVEAALQKLYTKYRNNGYIRVAGKVDRTVDDKTHVVDLVATITPGPQYRFGKLEIRGLDILNEPEVRKAWGMEGRPYQAELPASFLKRVRDEDWFTGLGKTSAETTVHEDTKLVDVTLTFEPLKRAERPVPDPVRRDKPDASKQFFPGMFWLDRMGDPFYPGTITEKGGGPVE